MAELIYIGILAPIDTMEGNITNENPTAVQGSYDATVMQVVNVSMSDNDNDGITVSDDYYSTPDTFTYDLGFGPITSGLDGEGRFSAEVIRAASTTPESVEISLYQLQNGATFVRLPDGYKINQLTIQSMVRDGYDSVYTDSSSTSTIVCFEVGTWIETPEGLRRIADIGPDDLVMTEDHGAQAVTWAHRWKVRATDKTRPVQIAPGALGPGLPFAPLSVSRQHRIYVTSPVAQRMFGEPGGLVAAHRLVGFRGVSLGQVGHKVEYGHIMCRRHELIRANGLLAETLLNAPVTRSVIDITGVPASCVTSSDPVRPLLSAQEQRCFVERIIARGERTQKRAADTRPASRPLGTGM